MPVRKEEAHRALELLEEYHSKLTSPQDKQLRNALERVLRIFKSRLFQALLDIQEFYEITLLNEDKSIQQKTAETLQIASKWECDPLISPPIDVDISKSISNRTGSNCSNFDVNYTSRCIQNDDEMGLVNERTHLPLPDNLNLNLGCSVNSEEKRRLEDQQVLSAPVNQYNKQACVNLNESPTHQVYLEKTYTEPETQNENLNYYLCHPRHSRGSYLLHDSQVLIEFFLLLLSKN